MSNPTTFDQAKNKRLPKSFGDRYGGRTLDDIASTDRGLVFLDQLRGKARAPWLAHALAAYLDDPAIQRDLVRALAEARR